MKNFCAPFLLILLLGFLVSEPIRAQIGNLYDEPTDQVAGINALMSAVASNDVNGVRFFSKAGRALVNQKNYGGATALHLACREKNLEIVKILIDSGADVNAVDNEGWTPLMRASLSNSKEIVQLLLAKGASASNLNSVGESALIHATLSDCNDCLDVMFEKFNFVKLMDIKLLKDQLTEAFVTARNRSNDVAQGLIESYLDRVIKMSPLIEKEQKMKLVESLSEPTSQVFRITSEEKPMVAKQEEKRAVVQQAGPATKVLIKLPAGTTTAKKFKFISGPQGEKIEGNTPVLIKKKEVPDLSESRKKGFKFSGNCYCDEETKPATKKDEEVILLIGKSQNKTEAPTQIITQSGNNIFKFTSGPAGKKIKVKPKPKPQPLVQADEKLLEQKVEAKPVAKTIVNVEQKPAGGQKVTVTEIVKEAPKAQPAAQPAKPAVAAPAGPTTTVIITPAAPAPTPTPAPVPAPQAKAAEVKKPAPPAAAPKIPEPATIEMPQEIEKTIIIDLSKPATKEGNL